MSSKTHRRDFYGWRVVSAAFVLAVFGLGMGFHGPPIYLHAVREARGWSLALVSTAVTVHFLIGAVVAANLPALYRRFGISTMTKVGAISLGVGVLGWVVAIAPRQLFAVTLLNGAGWVTMGIAAINTIVSPCFVRGRPAALALACNSANIGGVIFARLWVTAIALLGFHRHRHGDHDVGARRSGVLARARADGLGAGGRYSRRDCDFDHVAVSQTAAQQAALA